MKWTRLNFFFSDRLAHINLVRNRLKLKMTLSNEKRLLSAFSSEKMKNLLPALFFKKTPFGAGTTATTISLTTTALRQKISTPEQLDEEYSQDMDCIRFTIYSFVREYESESFKRSHGEERYKTHVWHFLETVFNNVSEVEVLR